MPKEVRHSLKKLDLPAIDENKVLQLIERWENTEGAGSELSDFQPFLLELCDALELPRPNPKSDSTKDYSYIFERPVDSFTLDGEKKNSKNRIDLYRRDCFVMEGKQTGKKVGSQGWNNAMQKAKNQADNYIRSLSGDEGRPPFIVVVDVGRSIQTYSEFSRSGGIYVPFPDPSHYMIQLDELVGTDIQKRLQTLWLHPEALDSSKYAAKVTKEISIKLAELAKSLEESGYDVERIAHFLKRCLFTMFSEDVDLIPEGSFTQLLEGLKDTPEYFSDSMLSLWGAMNKGGFEGQLRKVLPRFNGGLFSNIDPIPLNSNQIQLLIDAAKADWRYVEPAIFGTLLERALDPRERHKLGAHYTPRAYVERLIMPTMIEPLREEWETVKVSVEMLLQQEKEAKAAGELRAFHYRLCEIKVLDPACGSANFLYVALEHLKRLEGEVLNAIRDLSAGQAMIDTSGLMVDPHQFLGIEINPRAAAIAEIVLWIGFLQWHYRIKGKLDLPEPILRDFKNVENRDALISYGSKYPLVDINGDPKTIWDGISEKMCPITGDYIPDETKRITVYEYDEVLKSSWPQADFIVGNPPFIGKLKIKEALGEGYVKALRKVYHGEVPDAADLVMYWWHIGAGLVAKKKVTSFGFITTNSVSQSLNRQVIENHHNSKESINLKFAIPDHPWVDSSGSASVRIAMTVAVSELVEGRQLKIISETGVEGEDESKVLFLEKKGLLNADLSIGPNLVNAKSLMSNSGLSICGVIPHGDGFLIMEDQANKLDNGALLTKYLNGRDVNATSRNLRVIDTFGLTEDDLKNKYPQTWQWLAVKVKPKRDQNPRKTRRENWWLFGENQPKLRKAVSGLSRYIATAMTAKHRLFVSIESSVLADQGLVAFALDNDGLWGVLSSRVHILWALGTGGRLGVGNDPRYNNTKCFDTFPFPQLDTLSEKEIGSLVYKIEAHRSKQSEKNPKLTLTNVYNVLEKIRRQELLTKKETELNEQGLILVLKDLHDQLDEAVFKAYGWSDLAGSLVGQAGATTPLLNKSLEQQEAELGLLARLLKLNEERSKEESVGRVRWLRPAYQSPDVQQANVNLVEGKTKDIMNKKVVLKKATWPKEMRDQINTLLALLSNPATTEELAEHFKRNPIKHVNAVLDALEALGKAQKEGDIWSLT